MGKVILRRRKPQASTRVIAKKALSLAKQNVPELKALDSAMNMPTGVAWQATRLSTPAIGSDGNERDGDSVRSVSIEVMGNLRMHASSTSNIVRIVLIKDTQNNGVFPPNLDVFDLDVITSHRDFTADNLHRFKTLSDRSFAFSDSARQTYLLNYRVKLSGLQHFGGTTNADASAGKGSIWCYIAQQDGTFDVASSGLIARYVYREK